MHDDSIENVLEVPRLITRRSSLPIKHNYLNTNDHVERDANFSEGKIVWYFLSLAKYFYRSS